MSARRFVARPPRSQRPRPRRGGRLSPTNGSVTRADIEAIYAEAKQLGPMTADEAVAVIVGAITDWTPGPRQRARMSVSARRREARRRKERETSDQLAQSPIRGLAAA